MIRTRAASPEARLADLVATTSRHRLLAGVVLGVETRDRRVAWCGGAGDLKPESRYFIASTTKLYTTALVLMLEQRGALGLDHPVTAYVDRSLLTGIATHGGRDYAEALTIRHLLSHTSGIPDYFSGKPASGPSLEALLTRGEDAAWDVEGAIERARTLRAPFAPGTPGKALYSDTNFQLLGRIAARACGRPYGELLHDSILCPLALASTYLYADPGDDRPAPLRYLRRSLLIPRAMASFGPDGGIVSTAGDSLRFLRAFFEGELFPIDRVPALCRFVPIFFPLEYGAGIARFRARWFMKPFGARPSFLGHSGLSGAFAFYCPNKELYLAGTVNQIRRPDLTFRLLLEAAERL